MNERQLWNVPEDAICEFCDHPFAEHFYVTEPVLTEVPRFECGECNAPIRHAFSPKRLAHGCVSPARERELYAKAMRGE